MIRFVAGDVVQHAVYGEGTVLLAEYNYNLITVEFDRARAVHPASLTMDSDADIAEAKALLDKHGYAFRIYGPEDVHEMLDLYATDRTDPRDTVTYRDEITRHVMEGDDWEALFEKETDESSHLWNTIAGTRHDHPEWFPSTRTD